jgi:hypothetical protein
MAVNDHSHLLWSRFLFYHLLPILIIVLCFCALASMSIVIPHPFPNEPTVWKACWLAAGASCCWTCVWHVINPVYCSANINAITTQSTTSLCNFVQIHSQVQLHLILEPSSGKTAPVYGYNLSMTEIKSNWNCRGRWKQTAWRHYCWW